MTVEHSNAMSMAIDLYRGTEVSAEQLVQTAEMIRLYRDGRLKVRGISIDGHRQGLGLPVNNSDGSSEGGSDIVGIGGDFVGLGNVDNFPVGLSQAVRNNDNKSLTCGLKSAHTNSSSVATGDESVGEVATPSRREITVRGVRTCNSDGVDLIVSAATGDWNPVRFRFLNVASVRCDEPEWKISCDDWEPMP